MQYLSHRDPSFREKAAAFSKEFAAAKGPAERKLVLDKAREYFSGVIAEKITEYELRPLGDVKFDTLILPKKFDLDEACWKVITGNGDQEDNEGSDNESGEDAGEDADEEAGDK